jgi:elongation factor P--(R)-beta-lysine ligase
MRADSPADDFRPTASWENLRRRSDLLRRLRAFFERHGLLEVETPLLSADTVVDRHLDPFCLPAGPGLDRPRWLQTSPEFCMKRLLAAGGPSIYQVTRAFRQDEQGPLHNPEFTIVEWYRVGDNLADGMRFLSDLCEELLQRGPAELLSYREAFQRHAGLDPLEITTADLVAAVRAAGVMAPESLSPQDRDTWLDLVLSERVQPQLGLVRPAIVYGYPASQAALARQSYDDPRVAERFELYVSGIELANGYHEMLDADEFQRRSTAANAQRHADGKPRLPAQNRLLAAMRAGLPPCTGVALGFDRLVMLAAAARSVAEVIAFPFDRA